MLIRSIIYSCYFICNVIHWLSIVIVLLAFCLSRGKKFTGINDVIISVLTSICSFSDKDLVNNRLSECLEDLYIYVIYLADSALLSFHLIVFFFL